MHKMVKLYRFPLQLSDLIISHNVFFAGATFAVALVSILALFNVKNVIK